MIPFSFNFVPIAVISFPWRRSFRLRIGLYVAASGENLYGEMWTFSAYTWPCQTETNEPFRFTFFSLRDLTSGPVSTMPASRDSSIS